MSTFHLTIDRTTPKSTTLLIPMIRAAATIGFAIVPCSLGFVIIAVSEQLIRSIMVGDDPVMLMSDLQNQFPNEALAVDDNHDAALAAKVVSMVDRQQRAPVLPVEWGALHDVLAHAPDATR